MTPDTWIALIVGIITAVGGPSLWYTVRKDNRDREERAQDALRTAAEKERDYWRSRCDERERRIEALEDQLRRRDERT